MNAFVSQLLNLNKAISALYIIVSLFVTIGITLSLMLHFDFGLFYTLGVSYLGIYFVTLMLILIFSIDFRKRVVCSFLHMTWVLYLKTQVYWDFIILISMINLRAFKHSRNMLESFAPTSLYFIIKNIFINIFNNIYNNSK